MRVGFAEESYTVSESEESVLVCVVLMGEINVSISLNISAEGIPFTKQ